MDKLGDGVGTPLEAACGSMLTKFPCKVPGVKPGPFSAAKEDLTALMIATIGAGSWTPAAITGLETVEGDCCTEFAAEVGEKRTDNSACSWVSDGKFSPSKLVAKLLLVGRAAIVQAETASKEKPKHRKAHKQQAIATTLFKEQATVYISHKVPLLEASATPSIARETADQHCFEVNFA